MTSPDAQARLKADCAKCGKPYAEHDATWGDPVCPVYTTYSATPDAQPSSTEGEVERLIQCAREYEAAVRLGGEFVPLAKKRLDKARAAIAAQVTKP